MNSFTGTNTEFENLGLHFLLGEIVDFRKQLTVRSEFQSQAGWPDALNTFMVERLEGLAKTIKRITYRHGGETFEEHEANAADVSRTLASEFSDFSVNLDDVVLPVMPKFPIPWKLDGSDPNIPQVTVDSCPNQAGRAFITYLDMLFVVASRLDSRSQQTIHKYEAKMLLDMLNTLYSICQVKGGEANKPDVPTGTLPSQEPSTFKG